MMAEVKIVNARGGAVIVDVADTETPHEAAAALADHMDRQSYYAGIDHPHNSVVGELLRDLRDKAKREYEEAQQRLDQFYVETFGK